jgi:hypothetical protein
MNLGAKVAIFRRTPNDAEKFLDGSECPTFFALIGKDENVAPIHSRAIFVDSFTIVVLHGRKCRKSST